MQTDTGFRRYMTAAPIVSAIVPGLGQLMLLHWSAPLWFVVAILAHVFTASGWIVHGLSFLQAAFFCRRMVRASAIAGA